MKKRKELNALIGLGDSKRKKTKKGSGHRLLRTEPPDSESDSSSDDDEFNSLSSGANFGKSYTQCCNVCYPLFLFIILAACVMACAGLIWMQIALKEDLDSLKEKLHSMETSQKVSSSEIPKLSEDLKNKERKLDDIENGDKGLSKLWSNLTEMNRKISLLDSAINHLKANLKSAADLISLPTTVEELQKSVATIGSTLTSVQHDVKTMQAALENQKKDDDLQKTVDITDLRKAVGEANKTEALHHTWTAEQIHVLLSTVADLRERVVSLEDRSKQNNNDVAAELAITSETPATETVKEATTTKATPGDVQEISTPPTEPHTSRHPRFLPPNRSKRNAKTRCPKKVSLPGVSSLKDLEDIFQQVGVGRNSLGLIYQNLRKVFGTSTPNARTLECFDNDGDQRYSLMELRAAVGL
ncbi:EF-hand calcium-binding domain-containing protein 14 isoform X2 [Xiphias gladius]|uniref:EF-hand calcium-binding domain-containing protein 14 isoform X2 n=1 Tax=Xiphias gladius TaxID=8245 RepID=UPI001A99D43E|nr:EF-hand calcium-binding domain-containing protein 14 isoform X2 [Xiphias gladius]